MVSLQGCARGLSHSFLVALFLTPISSFAATKRGFVTKTDAPNYALTVGVPDLLSGIDIDVRNVNEIITKHYGYEARTLEKRDGTTKKILAELSMLSEKAGLNGTLFFYFSGHGEVGTVAAYDRELRITEIRAAIEKARQSQGPLERLVMIYDTCHSGSLLDPMRTLYGIPLKDLDDHARSILMAESIIEGLAPSERETPYWKKLFVFASSRADQLSMAGSKGSRFTNALVKAFNEVAEHQGTVEAFVSKTQAYTTGHNPVVRLSPPGLANESLIP